MTLSGVELVTYEGKIYPIFVMTKNHRSKITLWGLGYLDSQTCPTTSVTVWDSLLGISGISNHPVAGSIIVTACNMMSLFLTLLDLK